MAEKPILFSAPMVRALLAGTKTQTRRTIKPQPANGCSCVEPHPDFSNEWVAYQGGEPQHSFTLRIAAGDLLWVREAHAMLPKNAYALPKAMNPDDADMAAYYREGFDRSGKIVWRPSIHMPRWASRITLRVTAVKVERLQDIREDDAWAEGCRRGEANDGGGFFPAEEPHPKGGMVGWDDAREWFADLWTSINGADSWAANPFVAAYSFERVK